ncbi:hypothetical protein FRC19_011621 [Serendipita sp. 401]|nr:hypothetical protein FRC19_011621 [Serendipita sp. 401]
MCLIEAIYKQCRVAQVSPSVGGPANLHSRTLVPGMQYGVIRIGQVNLGVRRFCSSYALNDIERIIVLSKNCIEKGYSKANCANDFMTLLVSRRISSGILVTTPTDTPTGQPITSSTRTTESSAPESSSAASISSSSRFISNSTLTGQTSLLSLSTHISAPTSVPLSGVSQFSESELPPTASVSSIQGSSNSDHSTGDGRHGLSAAVIAGIVAGIIVALLIILVLWMLQRRRRRSNTLKPATAPGLNSGSMLVLIQTSVSHSGISTPAVQGGEQQFGTQSSSRPTYDALPSGDWSARSLARALVPHLSEGDIDRLADSIVTRMPATPISPSHGVLATGAIRQSQAGLDVGTGLQDDPPPSWRESWNSRNNRIES